MTMGRLQNQTAVITGGGSGMGAAVVRRFVEEGARVVVLDRVQDKLDALETSYGGAVRGVLGSVTEYADNAQACAVAQREFGGLDVFIGNAGIWDFSRALLDSTPEHLVAGFDELFSVNVKGYVLGARAAAPLLRESRGSMIFTLSNAAFYPGGGGVLYTAAKHAGHGLVRQLAYELAPEIRVNAVAPGCMATDLRGPTAMDLSGESISTAIPIGQIVRENSALEIEPLPEDYAEAYVLLGAPRESRTATGTVIDLSGFGTPRRPG
jgi:NAD(P)-dependent dehydrogenase (short-subunit alcohol dehydrogenase family)